MAAYQKFQVGVENMAEKVHDFGADTLTVALTAAANAPLVTNTILANLTQITYTFLSARTITVTSSSQVTGTYSCVATDKVLTASGGAVGPMRYAVVYNDTPTSPADPLWCFFDYGSDLTLADTETFTLDFGSSLFTLT
jgi:hypothetical protein